MLNKGELSRPLLLKHPSRNARSCLLDPMASLVQVSYRAQAAPPHISVDLMDPEGTTRAFSSLDKATDLVFAAYVVNQQANWTPDLHAKGTPPCGEWEWQRAPWRSWLGLRSPGARGGMR
jgi:hypothetical protein